MSVNAEASPSRSCRLPFASLERIVSLTAAKATAALSFVLFALTAVAHAQISGGYTYDVVHRAYFISGDTTVSGDLNNPAGNEVFVGKDNATSFTTLTPTPPITLTLTGADDGSSGANTNGFGNNYPVGDPSGKNYHGVNVFGGNKVNVRGGYVSDAYFYDASTSDISGGSLGIVYDHNNSVVNISGGSVGRVAGYNASVTNISGGSVAHITGLDSSVTNISGGVVGDVIGSGSSVTNISGGSIGEIYGYDSSIFNITGGIISASTIYQLNEAAATNFYGQALTFSNATAGNNLINGLAGVFYDVAWTRPDSTTVNTRYFDLGGDVSNPIPQGVAFNPQGSAAAPEPGSLALLGITLPLAGGVMGRRKGRA